MNIYDVIKKPLITEKTTLEKDAKMLSLSLFIPMRTRFRSNRQLKNFSRSM